MKFKIELTTSDIKVAIAEYAAKHQNVFQLLADNKVTKNNVEIHIETIKRGDPRYPGYEETIVTGSTVTINGEK